MESFLLFRNQTFIGFIITHYPRYLFINFPRSTHKVTVFTSYLLGYKEKYMSTRQLISRMMTNERLFYE
jgi:hypothetical protein